MVTPYFAERNKDEPMKTTVTFDPTVDALSLSGRSGVYSETLSLNLEGVDLNLDLDAEGYVLQLEVLSATRLLELIGRRGGRFVIPERIEDPETFSVAALFPAALERA